MDSFSSEEPTLVSRLKRQHRTVVRTAKQCLCVEHTIIHQSHLKEKPKSFDLGYLGGRGWHSYNSEVWHLCAKHFAPPPRRWFVQYIVLQLHQRCSKSTTLTYKKKHRQFGAFLGGRGWIRTTEVTDNRFTVCSLWPLGNPPRWS